MRKHIPKDAFIPTPTRVVAIIQLCLAFTVLLFILGHPFMGKHYALKSRMIVYDSVIQNDQFVTLPIPVQKNLIHEKALIQNQIGSSFLSKLHSSTVRFFSTSVFKLAWVFFSIVIAILLLKKTEGAALAAWILPLIACAYALDNHQRGLETPLSKAEKLFPSEKHLEEKYLGRKLSNDILSQRDELKKGWELFLVSEWAHEIPSKHPDSYADQLAKGEFAFNLERSNLLSQEPSIDSPRQKISLLLLGIYIIWNFLFAFFINMKKWNLN